MDLLDMHAYVLLLKVDVQYSKDTVPPSTCKRTPSSVKHILVAFSSLISTTENVYVFYVQSIQIECIRSFWLI